MAKNENRIAKDAYVAKGKEGQQLVLRCPPPAHCSLDDGLFDVKPRLVSLADVDKCPGGIVKEHQVFIW